LTLPDAPLGFCRTKIQGQKLFSGRKLIDKKDKKKPKKDQKYKKWQKMTKTHLQHMDHAQQGLQAQQGLLSLLIMPRPFPWLCFRRMVDGDNLTRRWPPKLKLA